MSSDPPADDHLGPRADRIAGMMGAWFGWGVDQFWTSTPAEVMSVLRALNDDRLNTALPLTAAELRRLQEHDPDG